METKYKFTIYFSIIIFIFVILILYSGVFNYSMAVSKTEEFAEIVLSNNIKKYDDYFSEDTYFKSGNIVLTYSEARQNIIDFIATNTVSIGSSGYTSYSEMYANNHFNRINLNILCDFDVPRNMEIKADYKCYFWGLVKVIGFESNSKNFQRLFLGQV